MRIGNCERQTRCFFGFNAVVVMLAIGITGCSRTDQPPDTSAKSQTAPTTVTASRAAAAADLSAPEVPEDAPVLMDVYGTLSGGVLRQARLTDLPAGVLLRAEGVAVVDSDLEGELAQVPSHMRDQFRKNAFFVLEQTATRDLLLAMARRQGGDPGLDDEPMLQSYLEEMTRTASVTDAETDAFYEENRAMIGNAPLEQMRPRIREHLLREKQQEIVENHIRDLGRQVTIALSASWVETQAKQMLDNPLDRARASGRPTMASFGADTCIPCQRMKPIREALEKKYSGRLNVVYVHADRDQVLATRYGIRGIPHLIFFDADGAETHAHTGVMTEEEIEGWLVIIGVDEA